MSLNLKIDGIYDLRTLLHLREMGIGDFGFDFSPRSFSFIQRHVFLKILLPEILLSEKIILKFDSSQDPMIKVLVEDVRNFRGSLENTYIELKSWDQNDLDYFEEKEIPFLLVYSKNLKINFSHKFLHGVILEYNLLYDIYENNVYFNFVTNLLLQLKMASNKELALILSSNWGDDLYAAITESLDFECYSRPINGQVEICYRNVDLKKITNEIHVFTNS